MFRVTAGRVAAATVAAVAAPMLLNSFSYAHAHTHTQAHTDAARPPVAFAVGADGRSAAAPAAALDPDNWKPFKLLRAEPLSHDTKKYTFALPGEDTELGLHVASLLLVKAEIDGKAVIRPYTPISPVHRRGSFELVVKSYENGKVSKYLYNLPAGAEVEMKGPIQKYEYVPNQWHAVGLIAGGSGITPMFQLIQEILNNPRDRTEIRLIFANRTPEDILLKEELDALAATHSNFRVMYIVDKPDSTWTGPTGYITKEMLTSFLPPPQKAAGNHKIMVCGPPGMMKLLSGEKKSASDQGELTGLLAELRYAPDQVFKY